MPITLIDDTNSVRPTAANASVSGNVLTNDIAIPTGISFDGTAATGDTQTAFGAFGALQFRNDGSYTYTPYQWMHADIDIALGRTQTDTFTYTVEDRTESVSAKLSIDLSKGFVATVSLGFSPDQDVVTVDLGSTEHAVGVDTRLSGATARDFDGSEDWDFVWSNDGNNGYPETHGFANSLGGATHITYSTSDTDGWRAQYRVMDGVPDVGTANLLEKLSYGPFHAQFSGFTYVIDAEFQDLFVGLNDLALQPVTASSSIVRFLDDGNIETSRDDFITNPDQTFTTVLADAAGKALSWTKHRADGVDIVNHLDTSGQRTTQVVTNGDNSKGWTTIERIFDTNGDVVTSLVTKDNGDTIATRTLSGGGNIEVYTGEATARGWTSLTKEHNSDGDLETDTFIFNNGMQMTRSYDGNGHMTARLRMDTLDAVAWHQVEEQYTHDVKTQLDVLTRRDVVQDDGDRVSFHYSEAGVLETRSFIDVSDTRDWTGQTWHYDASGAVTSVETDTLAIA